MGPTQLVGMGAVAIAVTAPVVGLFVPNLYEVRSTDIAHSPTGLRHALLMGSVVAVGVGVAGSAATGSAAPFVGAVIGAALVWAAYEWALRNPHKES